MRRIFPTARLLPLALWALCVLWPGPGAAQPADDTTAVDGLRCWRRVGVGAVRVGERFTMTVTCSVVDTERARTLIDQAALEPTTIDVGPFEVLDGERYDDVLTGPYRFFQYHYTLRVINETSFGEDLEIPALDLTYRIERRVGDDPALVGRELTYVLPPESIRIVSLAPDAAADIRDLPPVTFGDIRTRLFRANTFNLLAAVFVVAALGALALGAAQLARQRRGGAATVDRMLPLSLVVKRALAELKSLQRTTTEQEWTLDSAARALTALRIAGAVAVSGRVAQAPAAGTPARDGELGVRHGLFRAKTAIVSSGLTAAALARRRTESAAVRELAGGGTAQRELLADDAGLDDLTAAINLFTIVRYGRGDTLPTDELTRALETGIGRLERLRWRAAAPARAAARATGLAAAWWSGLRGRREA